MGATSTKQQTVKVDFSTVLAAFGSMGGSSTAWVASKTPADVADVTWDGVTLEVVITFKPVNGD